VSEHLDPTLGPLSLLPATREHPSWSPSVSHPQVTATAARPQQSQRRQTSLQALLTGLREPAILHRDGRIAGINAPLAALLDHPAPDTLIGLPADALLDHVSKPTAGAPFAATLHTTHGPLPVGLSTLDLDLRDDRGTLWLIGPVPTASSETVARAREALDTLCTRVWEGHMPDRKALMDALAGVTDLLAPPADEPTRVYVDLAQAVCSVIDADRVDIFRRPTVDACPDALLHLLTPLLGSLSLDTRVRVDLDVSGRPVVVIRRAHGPAMPSDALEHARTLAGSLRASLVSLDGDRVVRLRLPAGPARGIDASQRPAPLS